MIIREFDTTKDLDLINDWFRQRDKDRAITRVSELPCIGVLAVEDGVGIAAGFIRLVEGDMGFMDSFISNPSCSAELRDLALDQIGIKLIKIAKANKIKRLIAFSVDNNTLTRACKHGFIIFPHVFTMLAINSNSGD